MFKVPIQSHQSPNNLMSVQVVALRGCDAFHGAELDTKNRMEHRRNAENRRLWREGFLRFLRLFSLSFPYLFTDFPSPRLPLLLGVPGDGVAPASGKVLKAIHAAQQSTSPCVLRLESAAWRFGRSPEPSSQMLAGCPVAASWYRALIIGLDSFTLPHWSNVQLNIKNHERKLWMLRSHLLFPTISFSLLTLPLWNGFDCATECRWDSMQGS